MHEVNLTPDPETGLARPFQFPSIDGCFRDRKCKSNCNCTRRLAVTLGRRCHYRLHQRGLADAGLALDEHRRAPAPDLFKRLENSDQDAADQRTGRESPDA
jgi:hypothetical protein